MIRYAWFGDVGTSEMADLEKAIGQFAVYRLVMDEVEPERSLSLAVPQKVMVSLFQDDLGQLLLRKNAAQVVSFDPVEEVVVQWIS
jgi:hypothetical protein